MYISNRLGYFKHDFQSKLLHSYIEISKHTKTNKQKHDIDYNLNLNIFSIFSRKTKQQIYFNLFSFIDIHVYW